MKESAGTLIYRQTPQGLEVLLVHPSGNYNRKAPWSIPKGLPDEGESLAGAALRETFEETGIMVQLEQLATLGHADYTRSRKRIHCFAAPAPEACQPQCASWEVDKAAFLPVSEAKTVIHPDQLVFVERLEDELKKLK